MKTEERPADYWREYFRKNKHRLRIRSNQHAWDTYLADHPGQKSVPEKWQMALGNMKGELRSRLRSRKPIESTEAPQNGSRPRLSETQLERLEVAIDQVIITAASIDPERLDKTLRLLRAARRCVLTGE